MRDAVPEVKRAVGPRGAEGGGVRRVEADVVDGPHLDHLLGVGLITMASKGEVDVAGRGLTAAGSGEDGAVGDGTWHPSRLRR